MTSLITPMQRSYIIFAAALLAVAACSKSEATSSADSATATPAIVLSPQDLGTAENSTMGSAVMVSGNLDPAEVVKLQSQVAGTVTGIRVDRGTRVSRGTVMAIISAQGVRSQAAGAQAQVAAARAQLAVAQQRLEGSKRLFDAGAISAIEYRTAQANVEAAEAQVAAARAQSAGAGEAASRATIVAPISGVVSARAVNNGEPVGIGDDLFTVVNTSELELAGQVGVEEAARVRAGQTVAFSLDVYPGRVLRGRVARVDPTADPGTRQVGVFVRLPNPGNEIIGGQFAQGRIETGGTASALTIPESAVTNRTPTGATVFVVTAANKISRRAIVLGQRDETTGRVAVTSGLQAGERVVLNPSSDIKDGAAVSLAAAASTTGS